MFLNEKTIIIVGAGVSGLLLAQYLRKCGIPYQIYERDADLTTRGLGWGLTLHWSLPALRQLLPEELIRRIPETYVDRASVEEGRVSRFPFFNLSTGKLKAATPTASESQRIRVARDRFRELIATGIDIQWSKAVSTFEAKRDSVTVHFVDGTSAVGRLLVACDGSNSRIRRALFPYKQSYKIPIRVIGVKTEYTPKQMEPLQKLDPIFLQGTASTNDAYTFVSVLDSPGNRPPGTQDDLRYNLQLIISWPFRSGFLGRATPTPFPATKEETLRLIRTFAESWAEPFHSLASSISPDHEIKYLELYDWLPPKNMRGPGNVALIGDAFHPMAMYRGEGANHAIVDVLDLVETVIPHLTSDAASLRKAVESYQNAVATRTRPAVLASRQACMDAHDWTKISTLMNMPSGAVSIFFTLLVGYGIRKQSQRWVWIIACLVPAILGSALMSFLPTSNKSGVLAGLYLVNAVVAPLAVFYNWTAANFGGATKRAFAAAVISGSFSIGNIIGPQTFQARDAPDYRSAKLSVVGTQAGCSLTTFLLFVYYVWQNKKRRASADSETEEAFMSPEVWARMTDKENTRFRYSY